TALLGVDVVGKGINRLRVAGIVLDRRLDQCGADGSFDIDDVAVKGILELVDMLDKADDAAVVLIPALLARPLVAKDDQDAFVEKCELAKASCDDLRVKLQGFKDFRVSHKGGGRPRAVRLADHPQVILGDAPAIPLLIDLAVSV